MACPHILPLLPDQTDAEEGSFKPRSEFARQILEGTQCNVRGCPARASDLWLCTAPGCLSAVCADTHTHTHTHAGTPSTRHAHAHAKATGHFVAVRLKGPMFWCFACNAEVLPLEDKSVEADDLNEVLSTWFSYISRHVHKSPKPSARVAVPLSSYPHSNTHTRTYSHAQTLASIQPLGPVAPPPPPVFIAAPTKRDASKPMLCAYPPTGGLTGLANLGNTCFLAACLQALANVPPLAVFFAETEFATARQDLSLALEMRALMSQMWITSHRKQSDGRLPYCAPSSLLHTIRRVNPIFEGYQQQDSHEVLRTILNDVHERLALDVPIALYNTATVAAATAVAHAQAGAYVASNDDEIRHPKPMPAGVIPQVRTPASGSLRSLSVVPPSGAPDHPIQALRTPGHIVSRRLNAGPTEAAADSAQSGADKADSNFAGDAEKPGKLTVAVNPARAAVLSLRAQFPGAADGDMSPGDTLSGQSTKRPRMDIAMETSEVTMHDGDTSGADSTLSPPISSPGTLGRIASLRATQPPGGPDSSRSTTQSLSTLSGAAAVASAACISPRSPLGITQLMGRGWLHHGPYTGPETVQRSIVADLFQGVLCSRVRCRTCGTDSLTYDTFQDLSLPIPRRQHPVARGSDGSSLPSKSSLAQWSDAGDEDVSHDSPPPTGAPIPTVTNSMRTAAGVAVSPTAASAPQGPPAGIVEEIKPATSWWDRLSCTLRGILPDSISGGSVGLADCLYSFCDWEPLEGSDQYYCEVCKCKRDADKRVSIAALPEILCLHIKRFSYHGWGSKNSATVKFPLSNLDMSPFMNYTAVSAASRSYVRAKEQQVGYRLTQLLPSGIDTDLLMSPHEDPEGASSSTSTAATAVTRGRRVIQSMSPEVRAWLLHRQSIATGVTGVEPISAAAAALAGVSQHAAALPGSGGAVGMDIAAAPPSAAELAAASAAARLATSNVPRESAGSGPAPVPAARRSDAARMGSTKYELMSCVQHIGGFGGGHYIAHAKNRINNNWYTFDDSNVYQIPDDAPARKEGYLLLYARQRTPEFAPVPLPARNPDEPVPIFVSRYWWLRYSLLSVPGPVSNADILCDHGAMKRQLAQQAASLTVCLTERQYETLASAYGAAEAPLRDVSACPECEKEFHALDRRRKQEKDEIVTVDTTRLPEGEDQVWYLMSEWWLQRWRAFINNTGTSDGTGRGTLPPGPIDNARLLGKDGKPLPNLRAAIHYRGVNKHVWNYLHSIYGGGPPLRRATIDIYVDPV